MTSLLVALIFSAAPGCAQDRAYDVVVVGATPGGIAAAVAAARAGHSVGVFEQSAHIGGVVAGGLTATDYGDRRTIGGISREFFQRVLEHYRGKYGSGSAPVRACNMGHWFEPHVAEQTFHEMLTSAGDVELFLRHSLLKVETEGNRVVRWRFRDDVAAEVFHVGGGMFVDAQYEGDLMANAERDYRVGNEADYEFHEPHAGSYTLAVQAYNYRLCLTDDADNQTPVDMPEGYSRDRYLPVQRFLETTPEATFARHCVSMVRMPHAKTDTNAGVAPQTTDYPGANHDYPGATYGRRRVIADEHRRYILGLLYFLQNDPAVPEAVREEARNWGLATDEFADNGNWPYQLYVREARRMTGMHTFTELDATTDRFKDDSIGLGSYWIDSHPIDAHVAPDGTQVNSGEIFIKIDPYEIPYGVIAPVRTENLLVAVCVSATHVGYGTLRMEPVYMIMGHACGEAAALALDTGKPVQEVDVALLQERLLAAGQIIRTNRRPVADFRALAEQPIQAGQPVAFEDLSTDDDGEIVDRKWDFDGDGEVDSIDAAPIFTFTHTREYEVSLRVRDDHGDLSATVKKTLQVVGGPPGVPDVLVDDPEAEVVGDVWIPSTSNPPYVGEHYLHDGDSGKGRASVRYTLTVREPGLYDVAISFPAYVNRASNVPVRVVHADGEDTVTVSQRVAPERPPFTVVGRFPFSPGVEVVVELSNAGTDGYVIADAVRLRYVGPIIE